MSEFRRRLMMQGKEDYKIVDYILTNGAAYIDTLYYPNPDTEVELDCVMIQNGNTDISTDGTNIGINLFDAREDVYNFTINHGGGAGEVTHFYCWPDLQYGKGGTILRIINTILNAHITLGYKYIGEMYYCYIGKSRQVVATPTHTYTVTPLLLCAAYKTWPRKVYSRTDMKIYSFKILERGMLIKHFMPALKNGVYGMAEIISGKFYTSPNGESFNH